MSLVRDRTALPRTRSPGTTQHIRAEDADWVNCVLPGLGRDTRIRGLYLPICGAHGYRLSTAGSQCLVRARLILMVGFVQHSRCPHMEGAPPVLGHGG